MVSETEIAAVADDEVFEHVDAQEPPDVGQAFREVTVFRARGRIAARMIVRVMWRESLCGGTDATLPLTSVDAPTAGT